jgi:hypothetical protein
MGHTSWQKIWKTLVILVGTNETWWNHDKNDFLALQNVKDYESKAKMGVWHHAKNDALGVQLWALKNQNIIFFQ